MYYGLIALSAHIIGKSDLSLSYLTILAQPHFQDFTSVIMVSNFGLGVHYLDILFYVMVITGGILYQKTHKKDARLLRFTFSIISLKGVFLVIQTVIRILNLANLKAANPTRNPMYHMTRAFQPKSFLGETWITLIASLLGLALAFFAYHMTVKLVKAQKLQHFHKSPDGTTFPNVKRASNWKRFTHYLFDSIIAIVLFSPPAVMLIAHNRHSSFYHTLNSNSGYLPFLAIFFILLYYLYFEGLFGASPAKFLTGSAVISTDQKDTRDLSEYLKASIPVPIDNIKRPSFGQILERTFSRRIPLEPFSCFGKGWHDTLSKTTVIVENTEGHSRRYHGWWPVLFFGIYIGSFAYKYLQPRYEYSRQDAFRQKAQKTENQTLTTNLNIGDIIQARVRNPKDYQTANRFFKVLTADEANISVAQFMAPTYLRTSSHKLVTKALKQPALDTIQTTKSAILKAFPGRESMPFQGNAQQYNVQKIINLDQPEIRVTSSIDNSFSRKTGHKKNTLTIALITYKTPVEVLSIKMIEGKAKWENEFPISDHFNFSSQQGRIQLKSKSYSTTFKAEIILKFDEMEHTYILHNRKHQTYFYPKD